MRAAVLGLQRALQPRCCGSTRLAARARHDDWMAAAEREARAHRPGKGGDGLSAVQRHLMDSLDFEIKGEMSDWPPLEHGTHPCADWLIVCSRSVSGPDRASRGAANCSGGQTHGLESSSSGRELSRRPLQF